MRIGALRRQDGEHTHTHIHTHDYAPMRYWGCFVWPRGVFNCSCGYVMMWCHDVYLCPCLYGMELWDAVAWCCCDAVRVWCRNGLCAWCLCPCLYFFMCVAVLQWHGAAVRMRWLLICLCLCACSWSLNAVVWCWALWNVCFHVVVKSGVFHMVSSCSTRSILFSRLETYKRRKWFSSMECERRKWFSSMECAWVFVTAICV